jgi:hypothetical protein
MVALADALARMVKSKSLRQRLARVVGDRFVKSSAYATVWRRRDSFTPVYLVGINGGGLTP